MEYSTAWQDKLIMSRAEKMSAEISDSHLVELVLAGDSTAFEKIFERYKRFVASISARYFQQPEQIEEMIQISFTKIFFELKNFRGDHDFSMASWIGRITTNTCLDALRTQKRKSENQISELDLENEKLLKKNSETEAIEKDLAEKLLARISQEDRAILQMIHVEEMSVGEVSEITGWSKSKIKVRAFRARHALRKIIHKFL
ncbi:MAG: sigma-70 family RNA polymerase sigma factor [Pyrinomonadaceae bacterium]|nr:sigma-70 family RNA polymerase sigma factor [Pyrinomonadaceae bacterium]